LSGVSSRIDWGSSIRASSVILSRISSRIDWGSCIGASCRIISAVSTSCTIVGGVSAIGLVIHDRRRGRRKRASEVGTVSTGTTIGDLVAVSADLALSSIGTTDTIRDIGA